MDIKIEDLIEIEYLSKVEENEKIKEFENAYRKEIGYFLGSMPYSDGDRFLELLRYHSRYFDALKKEIFKKGFLLGLKAKEPNE
jgi:hypothetical protein